MKLFFIVGFMVFLIGVTYAREKDDSPSWVYGLSFGFEL